MSTDESPLPPPPDAPPPAEPEAAKPAEPDPATPAEPEAATPTEPEAATPAEPDAATPAEPDAAAPPPPLWAAPPVPLPSAPPRRRRGLLIAAGIVVVLVVLVGVPVLLLSVMAKPHKSHAGAASPSRSASPSATPLSPEEYQRVLDGLVPQLAAPFTNAKAEHTPGDVSGWADGLHDVLAGALTTLQAAVPPAAVASAHADFVSALASLNGVVFTTAADAFHAKICGGSSALSAITGSPAATQLRGAVKELATADPAHPYTVPAFLPDTTPQQNRQLANGTVIKKNTRGANVLKVVNKAQTDAVVSWAPANTKAAAVMVYVRAGGTATVSGIHDGSYDAYITTGEDWDADAKAFTRSCRYDQLGHAIQLTSNSRQYSEDTLTLSDESGNAPDTGTEPDDFPV